MLLVNDQNIWARDLAAVEHDRPDPEEPFSRGDQSGRADDKPAAGIELHKARELRIAADSPVAPEQLPNRGGVAAPGEPQADTGTISKPILVAQ